MKGHVDLLGPATAVGAELMGIPSFDIPEYKELLSLEKDTPSAAQKRPS